MVSIKKICILLSLAVLLCNFTSCEPYPENGIVENQDVNNIISEIESSQVDTSEMDFEFTNRDNTDTYNEGSAVRVEFSEGNAAVSGTGAVAEGARVTLTAEATYILSGNTSDGMVTVNCGDEDKVQIVFEDLDLTNPSGPAFYIKNADKVVITLKEGSVNSLSDGQSYEYKDGNTKVDATLFSRADITFNGEGTLNVNGNAKHGICSKDDLVFTGGTYNVKCENVALNGKDCVKISNGNYILNAGSDGIRSDNEEDADRGYVYIGGGTYDITSGNDGIQAQTVLKIDGGSFTFKCGGGSANASTVNGNVNESWGFGGNDFGGRPGKMGPGFRNMSYSSASSSASSESAKGIKSGSDMIIGGGSFKIDSADDAVHSNGIIKIENGSFEITSGDDGIHADTALTIDDGKLNITKSYEGLESTDLVISGGEIYIVASDDGLNAAGGNDQSAMGNRPGKGGFSSSVGRIAISGGYMTVNASGDGVDANGSVSVTGGVTIVFGPTNNGNASLDYDSSAVITGGTFIALGSSGMAQGFTDAENQGAISANINNVYAGTSLAVCDENGKVVVCVTAAKTASHLVVSCNGLQSGNKYTIVSGADIDGTDSNGYGENLAKNGGDSVLTVNLTSNLYGSTGGGMGHPGDPGNRGSRW